nr:bifunctional purple acid phosphatase 26 [Ipomoea batatas]
MHVPIYNSNEAHFMEGESMRTVYEEWFVKYKVDMVFAGHVHAYERSYRISNIHYNVSSGIAYPVPDKSAPVFNQNLFTSQGKQPEKEKAEQIPSSLSHC